MKQLYSFTDLTVPNDTDSTLVKSKLKLMPLTYLSNFGTTLEMPLINCEINLSLTWLKNCFIMSNAIDNEVSTFKINDTKRYVPAVTLSTDDNAKILQQLKTGFKRKTTE